MSKDTYIRIRLTFEEKRMIKEKAKQNNTNMSDFVLTATRNTIAKETNNMRENERISRLNTLTVEEFLEIYPENIQNIMTETGYYVKDGLIFVTRRAYETRRNLLY